LYHGAVTLFVSTYMPLTAVAAQLVSCERISGVRVLRAAPSTECWTGRHSTWGTVGLLHLIFVSFGCIVLLSSLMLWNYLKSFSSLKLVRQDCLACNEAWRAVGCAPSPTSIASLRRNGLLFVFQQLWLPFGEENFLYFVVSFWSKVLLVFPFYYINGVTDRYLCVCVVLLLCIAVHALRVPFVQRSVNTVQSIVLCALLLIASLRLRTVAVTTSESQQAAQAVQIVLIFLVVGGYVALRLGRIVKACQSKSRAKRDQAAFVRAAAPAATACDEDDGDDDNASTFAAIPARLTVQ
jgi:hypothetical protein